MTKIFVVSCVLLGSLAAYLLYQAIDISLALDDAGSAYQLTLKEVDVLRDFAFDLAKDKSRDQIRSRVLSKFGKDYLVKEDADGTIHLQDISFKFQDDRLVSIVAMTDRTTAGRKAQ